MLGFKQMGDRHLDSWHSLPFTNPLQQTPLLYIPILSFLPLHRFLSFHSPKSGWEIPKTKAIIPKLICANRSKDEERGGRKLYAF